MKKYNLTDGQKYLLTKLVKCYESNPDQNLFLLLSQTALTCAGDFGHPIRGDLEVLAEEDLLQIIHTKNNNQQFVIKQSGIDAVNCNFIYSELTEFSQVNIGAIIHGDNSGTIQAVGFNDYSELTQIVEDAEQLNEKIDAITKDLLNAIKVDLSQEDLSKYRLVLDDLKQQLMNTKPSPKILERLFRVLAFAGDIEGSLSLIARVWPYIYPFLLIAIERIKLG